MQGAGGVTPDGHKLGYSGWYLSDHGAHGALLCAQAQIPADASTGVNGTVLSDDCAPDISHMKVPEVLRFERPLRPSAQFGNADIRHRRSLPSRRTSSLPLAGRLVVARRRPLRRPGSRTTIGTLRRPRRRVARAGASSGPTATASVEPSSPCYLVHQDVPAEVGQSNLQLCSRVGDLHKSVL